jgi:hypothetical protein
MRKGYWMGWSFIFLVFGLVNTIGTYIMADVYTAPISPFSDDTFMTVGGQMLLLGYASIGAGIVAMLYGFFFDRKRD